MKHGLTARVLRTEGEIEALGEPTPPPPSPIGSSPLDAGWIRKEIELLAHRIGRAGEMELRLRERAVFRSSKTFWEIDRRTDVEALGVAIRKKPSEVVARLEETPHGCRWLIDRWAMLARAADRDGSWSEPACELAFDLLGTPVELRTGPAWEMIDVFGDLPDQGHPLAEFARFQVSRLILLQGTLAEGDEFDRTTAESGLLEDFGDEGRRLLKYEAELQRRLRWFHSLLDRMGQAESPAGDVAEVPAAIDEAGATIDETGATIDEAGASIEAPEVVEPEPAGVPAVGPTPSRRGRRALRVERRRLADDRKRAELFS